MRQQNDIWATAEAGCEILKKKGLRLHGDSMPLWGRVCSIATSLRLLLWATRTNFGRSLSWYHAVVFLQGPPVSLEDKNDRLFVQALYVDVCKQQRSELSQP